MIICLRNSGEPGCEPDGADVRPPGVGGAHVPGARLGSARAAHEAWAECFAPRRHRPAWNCKQALNKTKNPRGFDRYVSFRKDTVIWFQDNNENRKRERLCDELFTWKSVAPSGKVGDVIMSSRGLEVPRKSRRGRVLWQYQRVGETKLETILKLPSFS